MVGLNAWLGYAVASLTLLYFIGYAIACPTKELVAAVALEVIVFFAVVGFRLRKKSRQSREAQEAVLDELSTKSKITSSGWTFIKKTTTIILSISTLFLAFDFVCLSLTLASRLVTARQLYLLNPVYRLPGFHPALSAELLAGACIEANRLDEAEKLSEFLLDIRESIYGRRHPMIAEMYGNFAFIRLKKNDAKGAEDFSRRSIVLWKQTSGYHHLGNALTKLGNALTMQKRFVEAEAAYREALAMREREFGPKSDRVLKTLTDLHSCLLALGKNDEAKATDERIKSIIAFQNSKLDANNPWILPISIVLSFGLSYILLGPRGVLTGVAVKRIEARIVHDEANADPKDIKKLISLYNHRKDKSKAEYYESLLIK